ncbi:MAG: leucine-rich repeat protein [Clostridia bacterium]|nr:leucine-rich repeat protein [Clostridia bacterium]
MKKKIVLFLAVISILTCFFAISAGAAVLDSYEEKAILTYDESELVVFDDGASYPSYYIFADSESFTTNYEWLNEKTGKSYSDANVVELYVPTGITTGGYFKKDSSFTKLLKLNTGKTLQNTNGDFWYNQTLTHVTFGEGFTNAGLSKYFFNGTKVEYVIFDDNSGVSTLPTQFFASHSTLKGIYFGKSITNIGSGTFQSMSASNVFLMDTPTSTEPSEVYYFKSDLLEANFYGFRTNATTTTWVFPSAVNSLANINIDSTANMPKNFVFLTNVASSVSLSDAIGSTKLNNTNIYFPNINSDSTSSMSVAPKTTYFFGDGKKASFNGGWQASVDMAESDHIHDLASDEHFEPTCDKNGETNTYCFCGNLISSVVVSAKGHDYTLKENGVAPSRYSYIYENNNYFSNATEQFKCLDCDSLYLGEKIENTNLFDSLGYSAPLEGAVDSLSYSIKVNHSNIEKYQKDFDITLRYGTVAAVGSALGSPISIVNGEISTMSQSIACEMTETPYVSITIKIMNLPKATSVNCCAFAIVNDKVTYLGDGSVGNTAEEKQI